MFSSELFLLDDPKGKEPVTCRIYLVTWHCAILSSGPEEGEGPGIRRQHWRGDGPVRQEWHARPLRDARQQGNYRNGRAMRSLSLKFGRRVIPILWRPCAPVRLVHLLISRTKLDAEYLASLLSFSWPRSVPVYWAHMLTFLAKLGAARPANVLFFFVIISSFEKVGYIHTSLGLFPYLSVRDLGILLP